MPLVCQFHYLREAAKPIYAVDRHTKKILQKRVRGVRPIVRQFEGRTDHEAEVVRGYCSAVRSALTNDGRPPLAASGLQLHDRLTAILDSLERVENRRPPRNGQCLARATTQSCDPPPTAHTASALSP
jgi:hypothetical protein